MSKSKIGLPLIYFFCLNAISFAREDPIQKIPDKAIEETLNKKLMLFLSQATN